MSTPRRRKAANRQPARQQSRQGARRRPATGADFWGTEYTTDDIPESITPSDDPAAMIGIYALANRIRLISSAPVVERADALTRVIIDTYLAPNLTMEEVRARWIEGNVDPLRDFGEACREELGIFGKI